MRTATFFRALWVRLSLLAATGLLATSAAHAQTAPDWASVQRGSSNLGTSSGTGVAVAADGSQYVTGSFENTFTLGAVTLTAGAGRSHVFLAKYSAAGVVLWATQLDCAGTNLFGTLAVDAAGNVYLAGPFATSVTLGGTTLTAASDSFLAKYSPQGVLQWARQGGGTSTSVRCIATDAAGNVAIAGGYSGYVNFGVGVTNSGTSGCFFYRLSPTGSVLQGTNVATQVGTSPFSATVFPNALAFDGAGNAYIAGGFYGTMAFGATSLTAAFSSSTDSFLCKLDAAAAPVWAVADASTRNVGGLAVDAAGNAVVCGTPDIYLARFTPQGVRQWSRRITATGTGPTDMGQFTTFTPWM